ncbi:MAG: DUF5615 family PIN-like protein [Acidimicrobiales bacterium]
MKLLVDANLPPRVADALHADGFDAVHVLDLELVTATDSSERDAADVDVGERCERVAVGDRAVEVHPTVGELVSERGLDQPAPPAGPGRAPRR